MILTLALALAVQGAPAGEEIVVTGRAQPVRVGVQLDGQRRVSACQVRQSSGDEAFDRLTCETVAACSREKDRRPAAVQACTQKAMTGVLNDQSAADDKQ